ncbi:MAG: hypothetical protein M0P13_03305 [Fibrobacteraceae bacterium]|nr:hypothetical protein [Fibrobacteraceae bacterium]
MSSFETTEKSETIPKLKILSTENDPEFFLFGILVPIIPAWSHNSIISLYINVGKDSLECPQLIYEDTKQYSTAYHNHWFSIATEDTANWYCSYSIPAEKDELAYTLLWKGVPYSIEMKTETYWKIKFLPFYNPN